MSHYKENERSVWAGGLEEIDKMKKVTAFSSYTNSRHI